MAQSNILDLTRRAFISYLEGFSGAATIYDEKQSADKVAPCIIVGAANADEDPPGAGNFWVDVEIIVKTIAAIDATQADSDPKTAADALSQIVFEGLEVDNLKTLLSSTLDVTGYCIQGFGEQKSLEQAVDGDCWVETWKRRIYCSRFQDAAG